MKTLGNLVWFICGGFLIALEYFAAGFALLLTIVGIPFGIQAFKMGVLCLWPFGSKVVVDEEASGVLSFLMNVIWIVLGGFWIAITHILLGVLFCITIVGIPFGIQHFKLIKLAFVPFGKKIESSL